jgi:hypothetical protein
MLIDIAPDHAPSCLSPIARGPPFPFASCVSHTEIPDLISSKFSQTGDPLRRRRLARERRVHAMFLEFAHGGARPNSGGARENSGGARVGAGRPFKSIVSVSPDDRFRWYVVRACHGQTDVADDEIRGAGFDVVTAKIARPPTHARRSASGSLIRATEERFDPLFVRYIIVSLNLTDPFWRDVLDCEGVERIISGSHLSNHGIGIPIALRDKAIEELREILSPTGIYFPPGYKKAVARFKAAASRKRASVDPDDAIDAGTPLHMTHDDSPLSGIAGVCAQGDGARISMLMDWFNRPGGVPTNVARSAVEIA